MDNSKISMKYPYKHIPTKVSRTVADGVDKLKALNFHPKNILDVYLDAKKLAGKRSRLYNPMRYMSACNQSSTGNSVPYYRDIESTYNQLIDQWSKLLPDEFLEQLESYVHDQRNESGWENGFLFDSFVKKAFRDEHLLLVDPSPTFVRRCRKISNKISAAFSDFDVAAAYSYDHTLTMKVKRIDCLLTNHYQRALCFASNCTQYEIERMLHHIKDGLVPGTKTNIFLVLPTKHLEKRKSEPDLWDYIDQHFTIFKIILLDKQVVTNSPQKRAIVILQNETTQKKTEILVQKTRLLDNHTFATLEFRRIPYSSFPNRDRTLSEMYDTDYIDYSEPNRRKKPLEYKFTAEISIWLSVTSDEKGRSRPTYGIYDYPTKEQLRKNTLPRGKGLQTGIAGKWYGSRDEAIKSAEMVLLENAEAAKKMRNAVEREYSERPVSLKTMVFLRWEEMHGQKGFDENLCLDVFFESDSASKAICAVMVGEVQEPEIRNIVDAYVAEKEYSDAQVSRLWRQLEIVFDYAVIDKKYSRNIIRTIVRTRDHVKKEQANMRRALTNYSLTQEQERKLIAYLKSDIQNHELALMNLVRYYSGLPISELRALACEDFHFDPELDLGQLSVTKAMVYRSNEVKMLPEEYRRFIPLPSMVTQMLRDKFAKNQYNSKRPLFANTGKNKVISSKQIYTYLNAIFENILGMQEFVVPVLRDDANVTEEDINQYSGDLIRSNFQYHALYDSLMEPEETDFLMGRKPRTTEAQYYCDYNNPYIQLQMRVKLDRWANMTIANTSYRMTHRMILDGGNNTTIVTSNQVGRRELCVELDIDRTEDAEIDLRVFAKYGGKLHIEYFEEE